MVIEYSVLNFFLKSNQYIIFKFSQLFETEPTENTKEICVTLKLYPRLRLLCYCLGLNQYRQNHSHVRRLKEERDMNIDT